MISNVPTSSNEIQALASCGFYCQGQGHNLLFILGRKCVLAVDAFIIESSLPENIKARPFSIPGLIGCSATLSYVFKISSAEHRYAVNIALTHHNYSKVSPVHKCILM